MIEMANRPAAAPPPANCSANRIDYSTGTADAKAALLHDLLEEAPQNPGLCRVILIESMNHYADCKKCKRYLQDHWHWPEDFFYQACYKSNGFVDEDVINVGTSDEKTVKHLRCLVKNVWLEKKGPNEEEIKYSWYEMTITLIQHCDGSVSMICFGVPKNFHETFRKVLTTNSTDSRWRSDGERVVATLMQEIVRLYDESVWAIADLVRKIEKDRIRYGIDFEMMHELARHAIHTTEILEVAVDSLRELSRTRITDIARSSAAAVPSPTQPNLAAMPSSDRMHRHFDFCCRLLRNYIHRSKSNQSRLENEIHLALNIVTRKDAHATIELSQAAQKDSAAMRTIAVVTLIFLPATFVATLFGMTFFNYQEGQGWSMTSEVWIFWAVAIPLTIVTILAWAVTQLWVHKSNKQRILKRTKTLPYLKGSELV